MSDIAERVKRVLSEETGRELHELGPEVDLRQHLGLKTSFVEVLLVELESEFDIVFGADDAGEVTTVGRLVRLVERHLEHFPRRRRAAR